MKVEYALQRSSPAVQFVQDVDPWLDTDPPGHCWQLTLLVVYVEGGHTSVPVRQPKGS